MNRTLIQAVRDHARRNYEKGWDIVVEAYEDSDISQAIGNAVTAAGAIANVGKRIRAYNDYADDIRATAF